MIPEDEVLHPVGRAVEMATGRRPHKSCLYRWMGTGTRNIRLPFTMLGGQRMTSVGNVKRWMAAVTAVSSESAIHAVSNSQRKREIEQANENLADAGF